MASQNEEIGNSGEQTGNTQNLRGGSDQIEVLNRNVTRLNSNLENFAKPEINSLLSAGNIITILVALASLALAVIGAFNLSGRIDKVDQHIDRVEDKMGGKIDRLDDRFLKLDETISKELGRQPAAEHR